MLKIKIEYNENIILYTIPSFIYKNKISRKGPKKFQDTPPKKMVRKSEKLKKSIENSTK